MQQSERQMHSFRKFWKFRIQQKMMLNQKRKQETEEKTRVQIKETSKQKIKKHTSSRAIFSVCSHFCSSNVCCIIMIANGSATKKV